MSFFVIALAGCPPPPGWVAPPQPAPAGAGCPTANQVFVASFLTRDDGAPPDAPGGHVGWVMPLHDRKVDTLANQTAYQTLDAATAASLGVPPAPATAWMLVGGQAPCKATAGSYFASAVDAPDPNITYGVELEGCPLPAADQQDDAEAIVVVSEQPPTQCQLLAPQQVAARLGQNDAAKHWQRPTASTPIPPGLAAVLPQHECQSPGCETLWSIAEVDVANRPVAWAGAVNWLTIPPNTTPASECDWKADTFAGFFIAGPDGRAIRVTEGQAHPLLLSAVLADQAGARVLIAEGPGEYSTYDLAPGKASLGRHVIWLRLAAETYAIDERLGPTCPAESAEPAPLTAPPQPNLLPPAPPAAPPATPPPAPSAKPPAAPAASPAKPH